MIGRLGMAVTACVLAAAPAHAATYRVSSVTTISDPSAIPAACAGNPAQEGESFLAADPSHPRRLVATWGAANGSAAVTARTGDGGRTWRASVVPGMTACTGGTHDWYIDGWVDVDGGGGAHFAAFSSRSESSTPLDIDVLGTGSADGGTTWTPATLVDSGRHGLTGAISRTSITADPQHPGRAWALWSRLVTNPLLDGVYVARTDDGGASYGPPVRVFQPPQPGLAAAAWQMVVLADGSLLAAFGLIETQTGTAAGLFGRDTPARAMVSRSTDGGSTWSPPESVATLPSYMLARHAADPAGGAWLAWAEPGETARIRLARRAADGGDWSDPIDVARVPGTGMGPFDLQPAVAVARDGAVGVSWYEGPRETVTRRIAVSRTQGRTWKQLTLDGPFAFDTGGGNGDGPVGAYQGLAPLGRRGFAALFVRGTGSGAANPTDIRFARIVRR